MKKRILLPLLIAAFSLAIAGGCKKKEGEEGAEGDKAAKPAEGEKAAAEGDKPDEAKKEEAKEEAKEEGGEEGDGDAAKTGIEECDMYMAAVTKLMECDKMPQAARDAQKQSLDAMKQAWTNVDKMPDEAKKATADGCKTAMDALKKASEPMGCAIE